MGKQVSNDLIPFKSGVVRVTPIDTVGRVLYEKAYTTKRDFLTSVQISTTRTSETLENGNGQDKEFPTAENKTATVTTNTNDPKFNAIIGGKEIVVDAKILPILYDTNIEPTKGGTEGAETYSYVFSDKNIPVEQIDGKFHFEIKDSYGNLFTDITEETATTLGELMFKYDPATKTLSFSSDYEGLQLACNYYIDGSKGEAYQQPTNIKTPRFQIEVMGEMQSADTGELFAYYAKMTRATLSGDLANATTQKAISNATTYTFATAPVPKGVTPFYESFTPIEEE